LEVGDAKLEEAYLLASATDSADAMSGLATANATPWAYKAAWDAAAAADQVLAQTTAWFDQITAADAATEQEEIQSAFAQEKCDDAQASAAATRDVTESLAALASAKSKSAHDIALASLGYYHPDLPSVSIDPLDTPAATINTVSIDDYHATQCAAPGPAPSIMFATDTYPNALGYPGPDQGSVVQQPRPGPTRLTGDLAQNQLVRSRPDAIILESRISDPTPPATKSFATFCDTVNGLDAATAADGTGAS
jgi:hypothetical protein